MTPPDVESISWLRFAFASFTVITLLVLLAWGMKFATTRGWLSPNVGRNKRMRLISGLSIDARRRVVLIQKDDKEYTLLVGGSSDLLIDVSPCTKDTKVKANDALNKEPVT